MKRPAEKLIQCRSLVVLAVLATVGGIAAIVLSELRSNHTTAASSTLEAQVAPHGRSVIVSSLPDPQDPAASIETLLHVAATGGDKLTREAAIAWLDARARERQPLDKEDASRVMGILRRDGHSSWTSGYRLHFFNSAFNVLHHEASPEPLSALLHRLAVDDADPSMRLYALQHIGTQRSAGRLSGTMADDIHTTLETIANKPEGALSGLAVALLLAWDGNESDPAHLKTALAAASDRARPADVRVTSLYAAGSASLPLARTVSGDTAEPTILRKAAISRLGAHGEASDLALLEKLRGESGRLDQAVLPALASLRSRLADPNAPHPVPYLTRPLQ
jgi:hypothetical protein